MVLFIYLLVTIFCKQAIVLRNKPITIAMSSIQEQLAHTTDHTLQGSWLHCCTPNQTRAQLSFYSICV